MSSLCVTIAQLLFYFSVVTTNFTFCKFKIRDSKILSTEQLCNFESVEEDEYVLLSSVALEFPAALQDQFEFGINKTWYPATI